MYKALIFLIISNFPEKEINMVLNQEWRYEERTVSVYESLVSKRILLFQIL